MWTTVPGSYPETNLSPFRYVCTVITLDWYALRTPITEGGALGRIFILALWLASCREYVLDARLDG